MSPTAKTRKLVIFGDSLFAEIAYEYFTHDSPYSVAGFAVERAHKTKDTLFGLPVVCIEEVAAHFPPTEHDVYAAIVYTQLNRLRTRLSQQAKALGYGLASYVSSRAFVWPNVVLGEHCFIFENNVVQPFVQIGDNAVLWSGNHIGHHSRFGNNVFISSHVVISGVCEIGDNCFFGVNSTVANNVTIGADSVINMSAAITRNSEGNRFYRGNPAEAYREDARAYFKV